MYPLPASKRPFYTPVTAAVLISSLALTGCEKASERAEREYNMMVRAHASSEEKCAKKREIAQAFLKEGNEFEYRMADLDADGECTDAMLDRLDGGGSDSAASAVADELERAAAGGATADDGASMESEAADEGAAAPEADREMESPDGPEGAQSDNRPSM